MRGNRNVLLVLLLIFFGGACFAQEICNNGIDDDGNGLIDLNDDACMCSSLIESSLIPNPSFEDMLCCPNANEMLDCAESWIQASRATSDYIHTCGNYLGNTNIPAYAPLPIADGEGAVGFRDGTESNSGYKEYIGACLTETMVVGATYRLDFYVGFRNDVRGSRDLTVAFFGASNCGELPFGGSNWQIGCPTNSGGSFELLTETQVSGSNEWVNVVVEFVADLPYEVLVLGPSCTQNPNYRFDPYFYVDRLSLAEESEFGIPYDDIQGSICQNNLVLSAEQDPSYSYQWYKDGIAIIGETTPYLYLENNPDVEGAYVVSIITDEGCTLSRIYNLRVPPYYAPIDSLICEGDQIIVGDELYNEEGYYENTILAKDGCDSIIQLTLEISPNTSSIRYDTVCQGETYSFRDISTSEEGIYFTTLNNVAGCDSVIEVDLSILEDGVVDIVDEVTVLLGEEIQIKPDYYDEMYKSFEWYNEAGEQLSNTEDLNGLIARNNMVLYLHAYDDFGCILEREVRVRVDNSNIRLVLPNIFSPDGNNINDYFSFFSTPALDQVLQFVVYDRWGNTVFNGENIIDLSFKGWDGRSDGVFVEMGVYTYFIKARFLDGTEASYTGDITLIR